MTLIYITICFVAFSLFLLAERKEIPMLKWISKIIASSCFIFIAFTLADVNSAFSNWMIIGFFWCFLGDIALINSKNKTLFLLGIAFFALGHICFTIAFVSEGVPGLIFYILLLFAVVAMIGAFLWLKNHLKDEFKTFVPVYILIIGLMLAFSGYAWEGSFRNGVVIGAVLFAGSDLLVARETFIKSDFNNKLIGIPLYYVAQIFLALSFDW